MQTSRTPFRLHQLQQTQSFDAKNSYLTANRITTSSCMFLPVVTSVRQQGRKEIVLE